jgi:aspartate aminotransferase-like enzyme
MQVKKHLLTPGPTPVPPEVLAATAAPMIHHRTPDFQTLLERTVGRLQQVFRTSNDVLLFTASGTGAFESAVANLVSPGDKVLAVSHGEFGERWAKLAAAYGADVRPLAFGWGEVPQADQLARALEEAPSDVVLLVQSETSTGVVADVESLVAVAKAAGAVVVVDAVSSLGAVPLETDAWGIDVVVSGSQKALMSPPGLAFASVSPVAWERCERATSPRFYFDWRRYRKSFESLGTPFTPAVATVAGLDVALGMILDAGLERAFEHHAALGRACREGAKGMGLQLFSPDDESSAVVTAILTPEGANAQALVLALRDRFGITVAGGHGDMATRLFRIGHIGWFDVFDITTALAAVELILGDMDAPITRGVAVTRALEAYAEAVAVQ